jgi:hypothetical protein
MQPTQIKTLEAPLMAMGAAYNVEMTKPRTLAYLMAVDDLDTRKVLAAIRRAIRQGGKYMPSPSDLRHMAGAPTYDYHREWKDPYAQLNPAPWPQLLASVKKKGS